MQPAEIADSYDSIAHQWLEPHLTTNGTGCICRHLEYDQFPEKHVFLIAQKA
jgi:hypothetical protein